MIDELNHVKNLERFLFGIESQQYRPSLSSYAQFLRYIPDLLRVLPAYMKDIIGRLALKSSQKGQRFNIQALLKFFKLV